MVTVRIFVSDPREPSAAGQAAVQHARAAAGRFPDQATVLVLALDGPEARELGVTLEPTVLVGDLVVAAGQVPPAGHLVRAIAAALGPSR
jgi:hypothetical protein